jgi:hypothetical protein
MKTGIQVGKVWKSESQERPEAPVFPTFRLSDSSTTQTASCLAVTNN